MILATVESELRTSTQLYIDFIYFYDNNNDIQFMMSIFILAVPVILQYNFDIILNRQSKKIHGLRFISFSH